LSAAERSQTKLRSPKREPRIEHFTGSQPLTNNSALQLAVLRINETKSKLTACLEQAIKEQYEITIIK
jgi:hypothetical protein